MPPQSTKMPFTTVSDLIEHGLDFLGGTADEQANRDCLRSVIQAYREVTNARVWSYLYTHGRVLTDAPFNLGTIAYDHTGGLQERLVTLTGSTWPSGVGPGWEMRVGVVVGEVEAVTDPTTLTLTQDVNFQTDIAAGSPYTLYHDLYLLPSDYVKSDTAIFEGNFGGLEYTDPTDALWFQRFIQSAGTPRLYTITGSRLFPGRMTIRFCPYPVHQKTIDFVYQRRPRDILIPALTTGSVTVTSGSITATANGFSFPATCQGSIFRIGTTSTVPGSWLSPNPPTLETWIYSRINASTVQLNDPSFVSGNYAYCISDPIDCEPQSTIMAIMRGLEKYLHIARNLQGKPDPFAAFDQALHFAQASDSRSYQGRTMGPQRSRRVPYKYHPAQFY